MIVALGREILYLGVLGVTPVIWFRANEGARILDLMQDRKYAEILEFIKTHEYVFRLLLTTGIAGLTGGLAYLQLPLKFFLGWLPVLGRLDLFFAKLSVLVGAGSLAGAFWWEERNKQGKDK